MMTDERKARLEFAIESRDGKKLVFSRSDRKDGVHVCLAGADIRAQADVYFYQPVQSMLAFFRELAADWKGWDGKRRWATLEGNLELKCSHDRVGTVSAEVLFRNRPYPNGWQVTTTLSLDPGSLDQLADLIEAFFKSVHCE